MEAVAVPTKTPPLLVVVDEVSLEVLESVEEAALLAEEESEEEEEEPEHAASPKARKFSMLV